MAALSDTRNLSGYFNHSHQFYYIIIDLKGDLVYSNPFFQKHFSDIANKKKYKRIIQQCLKNPLAIVNTQLKIKSKKGSYYVIRWEFSAFSDKKTNVSGIQGIGFVTDKKKKDIRGQQKEKRLINKNKESELQKHKQIIQATMDGHEKERQQIGKELHDNINQHLTTTRLYLEVARDKVTGESHEIIDLAHKGLSHIIKEIRQLSQSLVQPDLNDIGLIESVKDICDLFQRTHTFPVNFYHRNFNENQLPTNLKLVLFRIIQEQLNNILRHAYADTIQIRLQSDAEYIILFIADNGQGFDSSDFKRGSGITNIISRAGLFNGQVKIEAAPGKGCSLSIAIPLINIERQEMN